MDKPIPIHQGIDFGGVPPLQVSYVPRERHTLNEGKGIDKVAAEEGVQTEKRTL